MIIKSSSNKNNFVELIKQLVVWLIACTLLSCGYYSSYTPDNDFNKPNSWRSQDQLYTNTAEKLPYLAWWQKFDDPTLNQLIESGLANNNSIRVSMANVEAAQGQLKQVELNWIPSLSTNIGYSSFPDLGLPGVLFAVLPTYTMNFFTQIKQQKQAKYQLLATKADDDGIRLAVIGLIANSYFMLSSQTEQLQLFEELDKDLAELVTIANSAYNGGITSAINPTQAKSELKLIDAEKRVVLQNIVVSQNALHYLLNENPAPIKLSRSFAQLNPNQIVIGNLPLTVIENRPDMIKATYDLKAANEGIGVAFTNLLPSIQLSAARGEIATVPNGYDYGQPIWFNQALLQIPVFNASVYGQLDTAKGLNKASYYTYTETLRKVLREVDDALSAHDLYSKRAVDILAASDELKRIYKLNMALYKKGIISDAQLLEHKVRLDRILIQVNKAKAEQFITVVNLYQDLAGGYNYNHKEDT
ncbi:MAG: hypothetical protein QG673_2113 [Pseudomonadota bacterium]|nr:hypothetical protein [Pseudomonadota bacterium]